MLIYSVIYLLLAIYVERINPGEFGVAQPWNYLFKISYWRPRTAAAIQPIENDEKPANRNDGVFGSNGWIELNPMMNKKTLSLTISHLTKVDYQFFLSSI